MLRVCVLCLALLSGPTLAGYCPADDDRYERTYWPGEPVSRDDTATSPLPATLIALIAGILIGALLRTGPTLPAILAAVDKGIDARVSEAGSHSRKKFPPALEAARKGVKDAITKVFMGVK